MLTGVYHYQLFNGLMIVAQVLLLLVLIVAMRYSLQLFQALKIQDEFLKDNKSTKVEQVIPQLATYFKSFIIHIIGYRGEKREITPIKEVGSRWMSANWYYVFRRFLFFYAIYITFGILLTRPVYFEGDTFLFYNYDRENLNAVFYLVCYILTNAVADFFSIYFTFRNLEKIIATGRIFFYGLIDLIIALAFFIPNQIVSCVLWYVKRAEDNVEFSTDYLATFIDIIFWPYALVGNVDANSAIGQLFPGQLVITGTVFFPTIIMMSVMILYWMCLMACYYIKKVLIFIGIEEFCRKYVEMNSLSPFQMQPSYALGPCNTALVIVFNGILISMFYDTVKSLLLSFSSII